MDTIPNWMWGAALSLCLVATTILILRDHRKR